MDERQTDGRWTPADVLVRAAEVLRSSGWHRYELGPKRCDAGAHCALGAIYCIVDRTSEEAYAACRKLSTYLIEARGAQWMPTSSGVITAWNDRAASSGEEVIRAMQCAAESP